VYAINSKTFFLADVLFLGGGILQSACE